MVGDFRPSRESHVLPCPSSSQVHDNGSRFESPGTLHKNLTFSEFCGDSYETEVSHKFVEYLKLCFRMCTHPLSVHFDSRITLAKETHQLYTLDPIPGITVTQALLDMAPAVAVPQPTVPTVPVPQASSPPAPALLDTAPAIAVPQPIVPTIPVPQVSSTPTPDFTGPIRTARKSRMRTGPLSTRVNKNVPVRTASPTNAAIPRIEEPQVQSPEINHAPQVNPPRTTTLPSNIPQAHVTRAEPNIPVITTTPPDSTPLPTTEVSSDGASNSVSYTSTLPDVFDVRMDDSAPPATGLWMIIDHFTGEVIVDEDQSIHPASDVPVTPTVPIGHSAGVEVAITPHLGTPYLVETPSTLLSEDEDVRPLWLMTAVSSFLRWVPCVGSLGKVIDLYLAQEARLGYPELVCTFLFSL